VDTIEQIEDFGTMKLHARHLAFELEFFQKRNAEMAKEIARLKELSPEQLQREIARQGEQLTKLRRKVFGASTERRPNPAPPDKPEKKPKRGHGPTTQTKLPKREVHHRLADDERECPVCQGMLEEMGELTEDAEEITVEKRRFFVDKHLRHKYRCGRCNSVVKTAPGPLRLILGGRYSVDFAIALEIDKRINHLPLDRQRRQMEREGLVITTQAMWDQEDALADLFEPSYLKLLEYVLGSDVIGADETYWRLMMKGSAKKWWMWCLTTHDVAWYMLEPSRSTETIHAVLGEFEGVVVCDAYSGYASLAAGSKGKLRLAHCFAHARRKFYELRTTHPALCKQALDLIDPIFLLERELPSPDLEGDEKIEALEIRRLRRDRESRPLTVALKTWAEQQTALPRTALAGALGYLLGHWDTLTAFLDDPLIPLDNNRTERALRDPVLGRKNHYGSRSVRGTQVAAIFYTLIETCILCGVDPEEYMRYTARAALLKPGTAILPQEFARERALAGESPETCSPYFSVLHTNT
jgi:transposase